jgi:hypothetical protein
MPTRRCHPHENRAENPGLAGRNFVDGNTACRPHIVEIYARSHYRDQNLTCCGARHFNGFNLKRLERSTHSLRADDLREHVRRHLAYRRKGADRLSWALSLLLEWALDCQITLLNIRAGFEEFPLSGKNNRTFVDDNHIFSDAEGELNVLLGQ